MTFGVGNGVRTRDLLNGNQILYQLSYTHIFGGKYRNWTYLFSFNFLERPIHATPVRTRLVVSSTVFTSLLIGLLIRTLRTSRYGISVASAGPVRLCLTQLHLHPDIYGDQRCGNFLSMLAYGTNYGEWCGVLDSNQWPPACKADALTSWANPAYFSCMRIGEKYP